MIDCLIIGGGPAGLTAAIYVARFHLSVRVVDAGDSRAKTIPLTRNHAGFPDGISGVALLERMREQAVLYGAELIAGRVTDLRRGGDGFLATLPDREIAARTVLLATGVTNRRPLMDEALHAEALRQFNAFLEYRRMRLFSVNTAIPPVMWYVVILGAVINIAMVWLFDMKFITHLLLGGLLAAYLGTMIFLIAAMDHPFRGEVSVTAEPFEALYKHMVEE